MKYLSEELGIIFDVDGVIVDVKDSYHRCMKETAEHFLGRSLGIDEVRRLKFQSGINNDYQATLYIIKSLGGEADIKDVMEVFDKKYGKLKDREHLILSHEFFKSLKDKGLKLGVLTGRPRRDLEYTFGRFGLFEYFDCIVDDDTIEEVSLRKHNPYALYFCVSRMGVKECVYVGDSLADYRMWEEYKSSYGEATVHYIHFGHNVNVEGVTVAENEPQLMYLLLRVLHSPE